ncbi:MAG: hypothetical protein DRQ78_00805 [Epsilonproteobacteria bacterium]|nr:MAG: hypothetical protein DRQ78_00805 [Campylobacterota bacterium]
MALKEMEKVIINNIELDINPTDIMSRQKRRVVKEEYIREKSVFAHMGKYAEANFTIIMQFNIQDEIDQLSSPDHLPKMLKLLCQLDNFPFLYIQSDTLKKYLTKTSRTDMKQMIFGLEAYTLMFSSDLNSTLTLKLDLKYFNHVPFCADMSFYSLVEDVEETARTRVINENDAIAYRENKQEVLGENSIFDMYFRNDYHEMFDKMSRYKKDRDGNEKGVGEVRVRYPLFLQEEPENEDYSVVNLSSLDDENNIVETKTYATWKSVGDVSLISNDNSPVASITISKYNNFASHSMTSWTYPVLQYLGKGETVLDLTFIEDSMNGYSLKYIKTLLGKLDVNQLLHYRYSQFNVLKIDSIVTDLMPMFGFILDNEELKSSSSFQMVDQAYFRFIGKDVGGLMDRRGYNSAKVKAVKVGIKVMTDLISSISDRGEQYLIDKPSACGYGWGNVITLGTGNQFDDNFSHHRPLKEWPAGLNDRYLFALESEYGLPQGLLYNVMMQESGGQSYDKNGNPIENKISKAAGLFQFTPAAASDYKLIDRHHPQQAAAAAAKYYKNLLKKYKGDVGLSLAAYNSGPGNVDSAIRASENAGGDRTWGSVKNHLVTSAKNQRETTNYVNKISQAMAIDSGMDVDPGCYINSDVHAPLSQIKELAEKIKDTMGYDEDMSVSDTLKEFEIDSRNEQINQSDKVVLSKKDLLDTYMSLNAQGNQNNSFLSIQTAGSRGLVSTNYDRLINSFDGEAYYDLELGNRLGINNTLAEDGGVSQDVRDINPMFFVKYKPYVTGEVLRMAYQSASTGLNASLPGNAIDTYQKKIEAEIELSTGMDLDEKSKKNTITSHDTIQEQLKKTTISKAMDRIDNKIDSDTQTHARGTYDWNEVEQGPGNEDSQARYYFDRSSQPFDRGINQAFPVIKAFIVEGEEDSWKANIGTITHEYYELTGLVSVNIAQQDDISPIDVAVITIANPGSIYTDQTVYMEMFKPEKNWSMDGISGTPNSTNIPLNRLRLRPGNRLHIRGGYSNDINKLETMFNGIVTEVYGEATLQLVCESYGRELLTHDHGDDPTTDDWWGGADTGEVIANFLYAGEIEHFGNMKIFDDLEDSEGSERRIFTINNIFNTNGSQALFMNIYAGNVINDYNYGFDWNPGSNTEMYPKFPIYKLTPWEAFKEMEYRHPGSLMRPCNYGPRHTLFFGIKEQLYVYRDIDVGTKDGMARATNQIHLASRIGVGSDYNRDKRLKPVSDMHIISSDLNIISNSLKVMNDYDTVVDIAHWDSINQFISQEYAWYEMKIDDNLRPMEHRNGRLQMNGINGKYAAFAYGSTHLKKEVEKMYDGKIVILGNQNMKSGDYAVLNDSSRDLTGIIKIRECVHHFDTENGFVTEIVPGLFAESTFTNYSFLFAKLGSSYQRVTTAARSIARKAIDSDDSFAISSFNIDALHIANTTGHQHGLVGVFSRIFTEEGAVIGTATGLLGLATIKAGSKIVPGITASVQGSGSFAGGLRVLGGLGADIVSGSKTQLLRGATTLGNFLSKSPMMAKALPIANGLFKLGKAFTPVGWAATIIGSYVSSKIEEAQLTRQPVRFYPLEMGGKPYLGGMLGYHEGGYWEDLGNRISTTYNNTIDIISKLGY